MLTYSFATEHSYQTAEQVSPPVHLRALSAIESDLPGVSFPLRNKCRERHSSIIIACSVDTGLYVNI